MFLVRKPQHTGAMPVAVARGAHLPSGSSPPFPLLKPGLYADVVLDFAEEQDEEDADDAGAEWQAPPLQWLWETEAKETCRLTTAQVSQHRDATVGRAVVHAPDLPVRPITAPLNAHNAVSQRA